MDNGQTSLRNSSAKQIVMIANYLTLFRRMLNKHPLYYSINIAGLSTGMICFLMIAVYVSFELSYDSFFAKKDQIYRVVHEDLSRTPNPLSEAIANEVAQVDATTRVIFSHSGLVVIDSAGNPLEEKGYAVDSTFFELFDYQFLHGTTHALVNPKNIVITERYAKKVFGRGDVIGETLQLNVPFADPNFVITGVIADPPKNSQFDFDILTRYQPHSPANWQNNVVYTYVKLKNNHDIGLVTSGIRKIMLPHASDPKDLETLRLQPLTAQHFETELSFDFGPHVKKESLYILMSIGGLILLIGCINFVNLSNAKSLERQKEIGVRKIAGASKSQVASHILGESVIVSLISFVITIAAIYSIAPLFQQVTQVEFYTAWKVGSLVLKVFFMLLPIVIGICAGIYPAVSASGFQALGALQRSQPLGKLRARKILVAVQFAITSFLIIGTLTVTRQFILIREHELGFNDDRVLVFNIGFPGLGQKIDVINEELTKHKNIINASAALTVPGDLTYTMPYSPRENLDDNNFRLSWAGLYVDPHFVKNMEIKLIEGKTFSGNPATDTVSLLINETAAKTLKAKFGAEWEQPIGKTLHYFRSNQEGFYLAKSCTIIGIVKDFHYYSLHQGIDPLAIQVDYRLFFKLLVKVRPENTNVTLDHIKTVWGKTGITKPFTYVFLDDHFGRAYEKDDKFRQIFMSFALISILISAGGLYGLVLYSTEKRSKEISIRKVLGANPLNILVIVTSDLFVLVVAAFAVSAPVAFYAMNEWLSQFTFRTDLDLLSFLIAFCSCVMISALTVVFRIAKVTRLNPVKYLKMD